MTVRMIQNWVETRDTSHFLFGKEIRSVRDWDHHVK